ncbi:MAG: PD40 domain-containing protein [Candidatus Latescibacteria bacterium]|nr:PD40 domain-containing protein [Candidatus Latescibacterota bacterium]
MLIPYTVSARYNPGTQWKTAGNEHFIVYYPKGHEFFAKRVLSLSGEVHSDVTGYFGVKSRRVPIVLHPQTDTFNGFYSPFPNRISLYETPAHELMGFGSSLDNVIDLVYTHEYTHYVHLTTSRGLYGFLTKIFGNGLAISNLYSPGWAIEGITTNLETKFTTGGRGRSPYFKSKVLLYARDNKLWGMSAAGSLSQYIPPSGRIYHSGLFMVDYLNRTYGDDAFARLSLRQALHPIRGTGGALRYVTGITPKQFYKDYQKDVTVRADSLRLVIEMKGLPSGTTLYSSNLDGVESHLWTNHGTILALRKGYSSKNTLLEINRTGKIVSEKDTGILLNEPPIRLMPDGNLYFGETFYHPFGEGDIDVSDLVVFDPVTHHRKRLTHNTHIFSADLSPDGQTFIAVCRSGMWMNLMLVDLTGSIIRTLESNPGCYWQSPCWSPDGKVIAVTMKAGVYTDIVLVDPNNGKIQTLFEADLYGDNDPSFSPDGRWLVFSSSRDGLWNIHAWDMHNSCLYQLTSVYTAAHEPRVSPDGKTLSFLVVSQSLNELRILPFEPLNGQKIQVVKKSEPKTPDLTRLQPDGESDSHGIPWISAYKPYGHIPYPGGDDKGSTGHLLLLGGDPVLLNSYVADFSYGIDSERLGYDVSLINQSFWPKINVRAYDGSYKDDFLGGKEKFWYRERGAELALGMNVIHRVVPTQILSSIIIGSRARQFKGLENVKINPEYDLSASVFGEFNIARIPDAPARDMAPSWGQVMYVSREEESEVLGSELTGYNQISILKQFAPSPLKHHGFEFSAYLQNQGGMIHYNNYGLLPRGYSDDDKEGGLDKSKTLSLSLEYRYPLLFLDHGLGVNFIHFNLIRGSVFVDHGAGWSGTFDASVWGREARTSFGTTISTQTHIFSFVPIEFGAAFGYKLREQEQFVQAIVGLPLVGELNNNTVRSNPCLNMLRRRFLGNYITPGLP